jgi:hypothetical protein
MRQDSSNSFSACDLAVKRIKHLFSRGKEHFLYSAFLEKHFVHEYDHLKCPSMITSLQKLSLEKQKAKREERKKIHVSSKAMSKKSQNGQEAFNSIAQNQLCSLNQRYPLLLHYEKKLNERKIKSIQVKEWVIASKNFKKIARQTQDWMYAQFQHRVKVIKEDLTNKKANSDNASVPWEDLLKSNEERQFQITRVVKYLSD